LDTIEKIHEKQLERFIFSEDQSYLSYTKSHKTIKNAKPSCEYFKPTLNKIFAKFGNTGTAIIGGHSYWFKQFAKRTSNTKFR
jgi:hypothetical protein